MWNSDLHHCITLERLTELREQAALEHHLPRSSFRSSLARFSHRLAFRLERLEPRWVQI